MTIHKSQPKGSALVMVLWTLAILSLLAMGAGYYAWTETRITAYELDGIHDQRLVQAALELAKQILPANSTAPVSLKDAWASNKALFEQIQLPDGALSIQMEDESGRLNLNKATPAMLQVLLGDANTERADAIQEWRIPAEEDRQSRADFFYSGLTHAYPCKHAALESVEELLLVKGMTPDALEKMASNITVYASHVNINTAPKDVLIALGLSPALADKIIAYRQGDDRREGTADDRVFQDVKTIMSDLTEPLSGDEQTALLNATPFLSVSSQDFRLHLQMEPSGVRRTPARYEVVMESSGANAWTIKHFSRL